MTFTTILKPMALKLHPQWLPESLEQTYQALVKYSTNGKVHGTVRQLLSELKLKSPASLLARLNALAKIGVIAYA